MTPRTPPSPASGRSATRGRAGALPNLIVIGARKCGTTSLHYYLGLHPQIFMSRDKELSFFTSGGSWHRGVEWYRSQFSARARVRGESSPDYTDHPVSEGVPERMRSVVPGAKLIYSVRDPIDRIVADYVHHRAEGREIRAVAEALSDFEASPYVCRSRYFLQLERYLEHFPATSILVLQQEDLLLRRRQTLRGVFRFLAVDESFSSPGFSVVKHRTRDKRQVHRTGLLLQRLPGMGVVRRLSPRGHWHLKRWLSYPFSHRIEPPVLEDRLREALRDHLREDVRRLRDFTGRAFETWCV